MKKFYSNGKLLLTGEYLVLDGADALAIPTKFGQDLVVKPIKESVLIWESFDIDDNCWFQAEFRLPDVRIVNETFNTDSEDTKESIAQTLREILLAAKEMNPVFLNAGSHVKTTLTFPRNWGLGTSSTLINNIAQWANINAFKLLNNSFGGSGYDVACAQNDVPILYTRTSNNPYIKQVNFYPDFTDKLFFVHLNQKQDSKKGIKRYKELKKNITGGVEKANSITEQIISSSSIEEFKTLIEEHETLISQIIKNKPIKDIVFRDYFGAIKSLGAWGGDFVLVTGDERTSNYFKSKGFETVIPYKEMIL